MNGRQNMPSIFYWVWYYILNIKQRNSIMSHTVIDEFGHETTYDDHGNLIHFRNSDGFESWCDYDDHGNVIHYRNSTGYEAWYGDNRNVIHWKDSNGYDYWYDANGKRISKEEFDKIHNK